MDANPHRILVLPHKYEMRGREMVCVGWQKVGGVMIMLISEIKLSWLR